MINPIHQQQQNTLVLPELEAPFSALRPEYLELVYQLPGEVSRAVRYCAAKIINVLERWKNWKLAHHRTPYVYLPLKRIKKELCGEHGIHTIRKAIAFLMEGGLLGRRNNPGNGQDRTYQYNLLLEAAPKAKKRKMKAETPIPSPFDPNESCSDPDEPCGGPKDKYNRSKSTEIKSTHIEVSEEVEKEVSQVEVVPDTTSLSSDEDLWGENTSDETLGEDKFSAPPPLVLKQLNLKQSNLGVAVLLENAYFIQWQVNRLLKTDFGTKQLVMPPKAFVKASIRKHPEQAWDAFECFQEEMGQRVDNFQLREAHGCKISADEREQIKAIAPYATPSAPALPSLQQAPGTENTEAYKLYQPGRVEASLPPADILEKMKQAFSTALSMPKAPKVAKQLSELDELNQWIADPILRPEAEKRVMASDLYTLEYDEEGVAYQVRRV